MAYNTIFNSIVCNDNASITIDYSGNLVDCNEEFKLVLECDSIDEIDANYNIYTHLDHTFLSFEDSMMIFICMGDYIVNKNVLHMLTHDKIQYTMEITSNVNGKLSLKLVEKIAYILEERQKLRSVIMSRSPSYNILNVLEGDEEMKCNRHALVVDDSVTSCKVLIKLFKTHWKTYGIDYETCPARIFEKGIDVTEYDIAFIDINMPYMDGYQVCRELRNKGMVNIIVAISSNVDDDLIASVFSCGFDSFLSKPLTADKIKQHKALFSSAN